MAPPRARTAHPGRPLLVLAVIVLILAAVAGITRTFSPKLGLDLRGGTSLTLQARAVEPGQTVDATSLDQAVDIILNRVNASGVTEAVVTRQGNSQILVSVPGANQAQLRKLVGTTAELAFRQVLGYQQVSAIPTLTLAGTPTIQLPFAPSTSPTPANTPSIGLPFAPATTPSATAKASASAAASAAASASTGASSGATAGPGASSSGSAAAAPSPSPSPTKASVAQILARSISPTVSAAEIAKFTAFSCANLKTPVASVPTQFLITCNQAKDSKYLLGPAFIVGTDVSTASAAVSTNSSGVATGGWQINVSLKGGQPTQILSQATASLVGLQQETATTVGEGSSNFAIVLDGVVYSDPYIQGQIPDGNAQISGNFDSTTAKELANVLKYGALPLSLDVLEAQTTSPTLGHEALKWGLIAGGIGLLLVIGYALLYYRGLFIVVVSSLVVAGIITYLLVVLLGKQLGYTLSLSGIAGLIVAIGITADSFVVFFERLRDEVREGRSLRTAVETGWVRARRTIISADFVSFLAAAVLYILSIADVKGFAFTLGLTTLIDIVVVFLFTKPLMSLLAKTEFFGRGHKWSGLDASHLGRRVATVAPGAARDAAEARARARSTRPGPGPTTEV